jgi:N utilization substance protein A
MNRELMHVIDQICFERGIDRTEVVKALEEALISASRKRLGPEDRLRLVVREPAGDLEILVTKTVVERPADTLAEIALGPARAIAPGVELGGSVEVPTDLADFGRIAAQTAHQVLTQRVREAERDHIHHDYKGREGEIITGVVHHKEKGDLYVDLGKTEGLLQKKEQIPRESYRNGDRVRAYVLEMRRTARGPQVILSRTAPEFLVRLFELEVPEIRQGIVKVLGAARDPGERAKLAVLSTARDVDPVGACVGMKGSRVQSVVRELRGEKVDIVPFAEDVRTFLANALAPAAVERVEVDAARHHLLAVTADDQPSLAIGKKGQNVRLAAKLLGWEVDIKSRVELEGPAAAGEEATAAAAEAGAPERRSLAEALGIRAQQVSALLAAGLTDIDAVAALSREQLEAIPGLGAKSAAAIREAVERLGAATGEGGDEIGRASCRERVS